MIRVSPVRIVGCFAAVVLLVGAFAVPGFMKFGANIEGAPEKWWRSDMPQFAESYEWSAWQNGAGALRAPPLEELKNAAITSYRIGNRQTFFKNYTFCQARYLFKDGSTKTRYATCPGPHVVLREYRAELMVVLFALAGAGLLALCILWPNRRMQPTPAGAADPER